MTDEHFRQLRTLILDLGVKIERQALEIRALKKAVQETEVVYVEDERFETDELEDLIKSRQRR